MTPDNYQRALWAMEALEQFRGSTDVDKQDAVADLLTDIMHLCDMNPECWGAFQPQLTRAFGNYYAERREEIDSLSGAE